MTSLIPMSAGTESTTGARVVTMNCRSLSGRLQGVFDMIADLDIDVILLQETRLGPDSRPTVKMPCFHGVCMLSLKMEFKMRQVLSTMEYASSQHGQRSDYCYPRGRTTRGV